MRTTSPASPSSAPNDSEGEKPWGESKGEEKGGQCCANLERFLCFLSPFFAGLARAKKSQMLLELTRVTILDVQSVEILERGGVMSGVWHHGWWTTDEGGKHRNT
jgi:hypothetical protein